MSAVDQLCLAGSCTVAEVPEQRELLAAALHASSNALVVDLSGIEQADVTLVQLLAAAQASAAARNRGFGVSAWSAAAAAAFASAGLPTASLASAPSLEG